MPQSPTTKVVRHVFEGGFATDFGFLAEIGLSQDGIVHIPWLAKAENVLLRLDGGPRKAGGTTRVTATQFSDVIRGVFDFWRSTAGGDSVQSRIIHVGAKIQADNGDGAFTDIATALPGVGTPWYNQFDDLLVITDDSGLTPTKSWDGTTMTDIATAPIFAATVTHKGRAWGWGVPGDPSGLYYSVAFDPTDWLGTGSGRIAISPGDGDKITAAASHKNDLWVFKGPNHGSIHRLQGSAPTGADGFSLVPFIAFGLGAVNQQTIFRYRDDLGFIWSNGSVHSLAATASYGDYNEATLSQPFDTYLRDHIRSSLLSQAWSATLQGNGQVWFTLPLDGATAPNVVFVMDYRFSPVRWTLIPIYNARCLATVRDPSASGFPIIMMGTNDAYLRRADRPTKAIDPEAGGGTAYTANAWTPYLHYGIPERLKTLGPIGVGLDPQGNFNLNIAWRRDGAALQSATVTQSGGDVLDTTFVLDTSTLGGGYQAERWVDTVGGGEFRSVQYQFSQPDLNVGMDMHGFSAQISTGDVALENV